MKNLAATKIQKTRQTNLVKPHDGLTLLSTDQATILAMFTEYEREKTRTTIAAKGKVALRICHLLEIHAMIEEEIFYPAAKRVLGKKTETLLTELRSKLDVIKGLIEKLKHLPAKDRMFDSMVRVLGDTTAQHFKEEEAKLFPSVRHSNIDLAGMGERLAARQLELATVSPDKKVFREGRRVLSG